MNSPEHFPAERAATIIICPQCGSDHYEDNHLDEALYREASKEAPRLRFEGKIDEAVELLTALYARRIVNFIRDDFYCLSCGVTFDA